MSCAGILGWAPTLTQSPPTTPTVQQAQARAYRIGQTRPVLVVRLVVEDSVEEHVQRVAAEKMKFADSSITGEGVGRATRCRLCPCTPASPSHVKHLWIVGVLTGVPLVLASPQQLHTTLVACLVPQAAFSTA